MQFTFSTDLLSLCRHQDLLAVNTLKSVRLSYHHVLFLNKAYLYFTQAPDLRRLSQKNYSFSIPPSTHSFSCARLLVNIFDFYLPHSPNPVPFFPKLSPSTSLNSFVSENLILPLTNLWKDVIRIVHHIPIGPCGFAAFKTGIIDSLLA